MKILIVDDSAVSRRQIERMLSSLEIEVKTASNGVEAMVIFKQFKPDFVTMDLTMPDMGGLECVQKMIGLNPQSKILVISALGDKESAVDAVDFGARGFLLKPVTAERLEIEIREILAEELLEV